MKLSEAFLESLNEIDPKYLEESEKEHVSFFSFRKIGAWILSAAAVMLFLVLVSPQSQSSQYSAENTASSEMKEDSTYENVQEAAGAQAESAEQDAYEAEKTQYVLIMANEDGTPLSEEQLQEVYTLLQNAGYTVYPDESGQTVIEADAEQLQKLDEILPYSYSLENSVTGEKVK